MTSPETIWQCEKCLRYFDAAMTMIETKPPGVVPDSFRCAEPDCGDEAAKLLAQEALAAANRRQRKIDRRHAVNTHGGRPVREARLPYSEDVREWQGANAHEPPVAAGRPQLAHADEQSRFSAEGDGVTDCNKMLAILAKKFNVADLSRTARGEWISNHALIYDYKIPNAHSRASQLRGSETLEQHPFIASHRLDVDTKWLAGGWHYSLCFIEHSERLKRERDKLERGQTKLV